MSEPNRTNGSHEGEKRDISLEEVELTEDEIIEARRRKRQKLLESLSSGEPKAPENEDHSELVLPAEAPKPATSPPKETVNDITVVPASKTPESNSAAKPAAESAANSDSDSEDDYMFSTTATTAITSGTAQKLDVSLLDNWDDAEGYYRIIPGELIDSRYQVTSTLGKGVFAAVVRAIDKDDGDKLVAVKIIRNNETMAKAGLREIELLEKLNVADPKNNRNIVRLLRWFEHKDHLCLVFENLNVNLRDVLKKFGRDVGINIKAIRSYAYQMLRGVDLLRECEIIHADIKPDNMLVDESHGLLKIADLGSASDITENEITPYLVSRFYRAPELILGLPYDYSIDMWSLGCSLYELYTGRILFPGTSNNHMLKLMMELRGKFNHKMLRRGQFSLVHFDNNYDFLSHETDQMTRKPVKRVIKNLEPVQTMKAKLQGFETAGTPEESLLESFTDLLDEMLTLNPAKRITPRSAMAHAFFKDMH